MMQCCCCCYGFNSKFLLYFPELYAKNTDRRGVQCFKTSFHTVRKHRSLLAAIVASLHMPIVFLCSPII